MMPIPMPAPIAVPAWHSSSASPTSPSQLLAAELAPAMIQIRKRTCTTKMNHVNFHQLRIVSPILFNWTLQNAQIRVKSDAVAWLVVRRHPASVG